MARKSDFMLKHEAEHLKSLKQKHEISKSFNGNQYVQIE